MNDKSLPFLQLRNPQTHHNRHRNRCTLSNRLRRDCPQGFQAHSKTQHRRLSPGIISHNPQIQAVWISVPSGLSLVVLSTFRMRWRKRGVSQPRKGCPRTARRDQVFLSSTNSVSIHVNLQRSSFARRSAIEWSCVPTVSVSVAFASATQ